MHLRDVFEFEFKFETTRESGYTEVEIWHAARDDGNDYVIEAIWKRVRDGTQRPGVGREIPAEVPLDGYGYVQIVHVKLRCIILLAEKTLVKKLYSIVNLLIDCLYLSRPQGRICTVVAWSPICTNLAGIFTRNPDPSLYPHKGLL